MFSMNIKIIVICTYIALIYWLSLHVSFLDTLFFPTIGAFSFLFVTRSFRCAEIGKITFGAFVSSMIGTLIFWVYPSSISLFVNVLFTMWLIKRLNWNAPPIVAVSLIPFFSHSAHPWLIPVSVCMVLLGLMLFLFLAERIEKLWAGSGITKFGLNLLMGSKAE